jgi:alpha-1,3/alpha-1,6-mannosyltransferase
LNNLRTLADRLYLSHTTVTSTTTDPIPPLTQIIFLLNFTTAQRTHLLTSPSTLGLLYTPANEHFGIVPIEAMACGLPVIAADSGGPTETIVDLGSSPEEGTGYLLPPTPDEWKGALATLLHLSPDVRKRIGGSARKRVQEKFSLSTLGEQLDIACRDAIKRGEDVHGEIGDTLMWFGAALVGFAGLNLGIIWWLYGGL